MPLDRVRLVQCDTAFTPDQGTTSGAQSHPANFNKTNLALGGSDRARSAGAARRAAPRRCPAESCLPRTAWSASRPMLEEASSYGDLIGGRRFEMRLNPSAKRKHPSEWTVLGTPVTRVDIPALATGPLRVRPQRPRTRACSTGASCGRLQSARSSSASTRARCADLPGLVKVVVKKELHWRRGRKAMAGDAGGGEAEGHMVGRRRAPAQRTFYDGMRKSRARYIDR